MSENQTPISPLELFQNQVADYLSEHVVFTTNGLEHSDPLQRHTTQERFTLILGQSTEARKKGNYGIAAACVFQFTTKVGLFEVTIFGQNTLIQDNNPLGHAEANVFANINKIFLAEKPIDAFKELQSQGFALLRPLPEEHPLEPTTLYTSLECCPMCTVAALNSAVPKIVVGAADAYSGAIHPERLRALAKVWSDIKEQQQVEVVFCQNDDPKDPYFVDNQLQDLLNKSFFDNRDELDEHMKTHKSIKEAEILIESLIPQLLTSKDLPDEDFSG